MTPSGPGYTHKSGFQHLYDVLKKNSGESDVGELWIYILRRYFTNDDHSNDEYSIALRQQPRDGSSRSEADITIKAMSQGRYQKIIFIEGKRVALESHGSTWSRAVTQLYRDMDAARKSNHAERSRHLYGIVTVGRYSRFYQLRPDASALEDYAGTSGQYYEFRVDEDDIDRLLLELKSKTK